MHESDSDSETGLRVTLGGKNGSKGMFVDEVIDLSEAPACWPVPRHRVAYILDVTATPECLQGRRKQMSVDGYAKKQASVQWNIVNDIKKSILQCQDAWDGPTGNKKRGLAKVTILDEASDDFLSDFERWEDDSASATQDLISGPTRTAKIAEASDVAAVATAFYRSVTNQNCKIKTDGQFPCGGHAILRKFREGKSNGKAHFVGCSNWVDGDGLSHRFTKIPAAVREDILRQLFRGEEIVVEDAEIVEGFCSHIVHPSHLPMNKVCREYSLSKALLKSNTCHAELLILIPVDETDLRAVVIPKFDIPHCHPTFLRTKVPPSTKSLLGGKLPQEVHPSMINNRKRREMVQKIRTIQFPEGTGLRLALQPQPEGVSQPSHHYISIDSPEDLSPVAGPSRLPELNLFPDLPPMTPISAPRSNFDYQLALRTDILDVALNRIAYDNSKPVDFDSQDHPLYSVGDSEDEILVSDPYLQS
ncbi:hypothetical protein C8J57DRAFT_1512046 [Mycena rebaudengoi]|nr:hypothetical protein C8J57DRAFT_1512046 [Mycena rebaudengoi]